MIESSLLQETRSRTFLRAVLLALLYCLPILLATRPLVDPDIWWHLREGQWIVSHYAVPTTDPFSTHGLGKPWIAYSWLFEVLVYGLFRCFGLPGLVVYVAALSLVITAALHAFLRRIQPHSSLVAILTATGILAMAPVLVHPRPWLLTILFFIVEVGLIGAARQSGRSWTLLLLPMMFGLWANINIQFVYGLFVLGLAAIEPLIEPYTASDAQARQLRFRWMVGIFLLSSLATLLNPYGLHVYVPVFDAVRLTKPFSFLQELAAPRFRSVFDWLMLTVTLAAVFLLGRRKDVRTFPALLLVVGVFLSFRAARDVWFVVVAALAVLAESWPGQMRTRERLPTSWALAVVGTVLVVTASTSYTRLSAGRLDAAIAETFPEAATAVVDDRHYPGPIYNHYDWGGYLVWRLPQLLVSMDGRNPLHGDERILRSVATWDGQRGWDSDPELLSAGVVIGRTNSALVSLLRGDRRFDLVYEDPLAAVFVPRRGSN
jgi:hypothetical protein